MQNENGERDVNEEDRAPPPVQAQRTYQHATNCWADSGRNTDDHAENAEGTGTLAALEKFLNKANNLRSRNRCADTLQDTHDDQNFGASGKTTGQGGHHEKKRTGEEDGASPNDVTKPSRRNEQKTKRNGITSHNPLELSGGCM